MKAETNNTSENLKADYIKHLQETRNHYYNIGNYLKVDKIQKEIDNLNSQKVTK